MWAAIAEKMMPQDTTSFSKECIQSNVDFCLAAFDPRYGMLLGIGPATPCSVACAQAAKHLYTIHQEKLVICGPTPDAMLLQAKMWYDEEMKDDEWLIFDEDNFFFWCNAGMRHNWRLEEHTYAFKLKRFAKQWAEDSSHEQHENAKAYLEELLMQRFQKNHADPEEEQVKQEQSSKKEAALKDYFWSQIKVLFCTNTGAGHAQLQNQKFKPDAIVMDQVNRVTINLFIPVLSWRGANPKLIMAGDIRTPNPDPPDLSAHAHNGFSGLFMFDVLRQHVGTPENLYQDSDYHVVVLHDK